MQDSPILEFYTEDEINRIRIRYVSDEDISGVMNGESGFHIFHVRMITEFLLRELSTFKPEYALGENDISAIATASALHDIGKSQIFPADFLP